MEKELLKKEIKSSINKIEKLIIEMEDRKLVLNEKEKLDKLLDEYMNFLK